MKLDIYFKHESEYSLHTYIFISILFDFQQGDEEDAGVV